MRLFKRLLILLSFLPTIVFAQGYDVFALGYYDIKFDGSSTKESLDLRYERRLDNSLFQIGPEDENFFNLKPFLGIETTSQSAFYILGGIYLEDDLGKLLIGEKSKFILTPSFGAGYYDDGDGKKLGNNIQFRSTLELSYQLENNNRIGFSFGHISNANIGDKNPGVEILSLSYQIPFN